MFGFISRHYKLIVVGIVLVGLGLVVGKKLAFRSRIEYQTATATYKNLEQALEVSGKVEAEKKAILTWQTGGKLSWIGVEEGDLVKQWQAVASLDKQILEREVEKTLSDYMHQRWDFEQIREDNLVTTDNYDRYTLTNAVRRQIEQEQFLLDKTVTEVEIKDITKKLAILVTPIAGVVTRVDKPIAGVNVTVADAIEIVDPGSLYFEVEIDEADIGGIEIGQTAELTLEAFNDETMQTQIASIDFKASEGESGGIVFLAKLKFISMPLKILRLGMTGEAQIMLERKVDALVVPAKAVKERGGKRWGKVKQDETVSEREVVTG